MELRQESSRALLRPCGFTG